MPLPLLFGLGLLGLWAVSTLNTHHAARRSYPVDPPQSRRELLQRLDKVVGKMATASDQPDALARLEHERAALVRMLQQTARDPSQMTTLLRRFQHAATRLRTKGPSALPSIQQELEGIGRKIEVL